MAYLEYIDPRAQDLNAEILQHPALMELLSQHTDPAMKLAHVAAYCGVMLDGAYIEEELNVLCDILNRKLKEKRTLVLTIPSNTTLQ